VLVRHVTARLTAAWRRPTVGVMSGSTPLDASEEIPAELVRVRNSVAIELDAQLGLRGETIILADVCEVAYAIAVRLGLEFCLEPRTVRQGELPDDDSLGVDGAVFYGSLIHDGAPDRYPVFDHRWPSVAGQRD